MQNKSLWLKDIESDNINVLNQNEEVDVLIIGGGITGLSSAYFLKDSNLKVSLVEQNLVASGTSAKTTGKINYLQETIYSDLSDNYGFDVAKKYFESQKLAMNTIQKVINKEKIKCNYEKVSAYVFTNNSDNIDKLKKEKDILEKFGVLVQQHYKNNKIIKSSYAISVNDTAVFHPIKYLMNLKELCKKSGIEIYEKTKIWEIKKRKKYYVCLSDKYIIKAKKVILACHYPFFLKPFFMPLKVHLEKSYITASSSKLYQKKTFITSDVPNKSIRYHRDDKNYFIYLSNSHNICNKLNDKRNFEKTIKEVKRLGYKPEYIWSNDDLITMDGMPCIGSIEKNNRSLLIATGYNTWGMTNGTLAGILISDIILNKYNEYEQLFSPLRFKFMPFADSYILNIASSVKSFVENKVIKNKYWYGDNVFFERRNGKSVGIYNDGVKDHIVYNKCPHMGCSLIFNEVEKTWDCPCHSSRFNIDGKCIKGPSTFDISYKK